MDGEDVRHANSDGISSGPGEQKSFFCTTDFYNAQ